MPYVNHRWLGGLLTNFQTINQRIRRLHDLERYETEGQLGLLPTRERMAAEADLAKLRANLGGVKYMQRTPDAMFVIDLKTEAIAVREAQRLRIPIIGLVDTNCDPDGIDFVVPGNDDAIKSCSVVAHAIGEAARDGRLAFAAERAEEEERVRREAEERARREAEEQARREAEAQAAAQAAAEADRAAQEAAEAQAVAAEGIPGPDPEAAVTPQAQTDEVQADVPHPAPPADTTPDPEPTAAQDAPAEPAAPAAEPAAPAEAAPAAPEPEPAADTAPETENATQEQNA
jgi:small subunit ribosomal protein S2